MDSENNIELRSEEVQEILGTPPRRIIRWGLTVILCVIIVLIAGSFIFKYPDRIDSRVTIMSENPPVSIVAKTDGKIDLLFVHDNRQVLKGEILGVLENTADFNNALILLSQLDSLRSYFDTPSHFSDLSFSENYNLGQYQSYFSAFISQLRSAQAFYSYNPYDQKVRSLQKQIFDYNNYFAKLRDRIKVIRQDFELSFFQFSRDSALLSQQFISEYEAEQSRATMLKQKIAYQDAMAGLAETEMIINGLKEQIREQEVFKSETEIQLIATLRDRYEVLLSQLKEWEHLFVLKSPIDGRVTFTNYWSQNQFVNSGNIVFTIVPLDEQKIIGRAVIPVSGAGKIEQGQRVNIKLDNYPYLEFGVITGKIESISLVPVEKDGKLYYTAEVSLNNSLVTNYGKTLQFNQEMQGVAEIITNERRLIERLIDPIISIFREYL